MHVRSGLRRSPKETKVPNGGSERDGHSTLIRVHLFQPCNRTFSSPAYSVLYKDLLVLTLSLPGSGRGIALRGSAEQGF
jgi:hypothetical protein